MPQADDDAPPNDGPDRIARTLGAFTAVTQGPGLLGAGNEAPKISEPIPIYAIGLPQADSTPATLLKRARRIGWRYLVFRGKELHVADIRSGDVDSVGGATPPVGSDRPELIRSRTLVEQIVATGKLAEKSVPREAGYQVRLLDFSILGESVLWLVSNDNAAPDRFFALSPQPRELDPGEFLRRISIKEREKAVVFSGSLGESGG